MLYIDHPSVQLLDMQLCRCEGFRSAPCPSIFLTVRALAGSLSLVRRADAGHVAHCSGYAGISLLLFELKQRKTNKKMKCGCAVVMR